MAEHSRPEPQAESGPPAPAQAPALAQAPAVGVRPTTTQDVVVASFNVHCGVDGWARRFDVTAACATIDADILVVEENWAPDGEPSLAAQVASQLGYELVEVELARAGVLDEDPQLAGPGGPATWSPRGERRHVPRALLLEGSRPDGEVARSRVRRGDGGRVRRPGSWGLALLSRLPLASVEVVELREVPGDIPRRRAVVAGLASGLTVTGVHFAHLENGSPLQMRQLARELRRRGGPQVLTGDMNSWTQPLLAMMPGWRRAVRGRTWPASTPHSQIDHLLVSGGATASSGEVLPPFGSDHRAVRARVQA